MILTDKLKVIADCWPDPDGEPDRERLESANTELFEKIRYSKRFPTNKVIRLLDMGSGSKGSEFVNRYAKEFPKTEVVYLDSYKPFLDKLDKPNKIYADATQMPFPDKTFDIAYAGHIIPSGVVKDDWHLKDESYRITKEGHRVIKKGGLFIFTYVLGDRPQTIKNLSEIGFKELELIQRIKWYGGDPTDTYVARK